MTRKHEPRVPEGVDVTRPSIARIYDYLLFGKDNFAADRAAAEKLMQSRLEPRRLALANRAFLRRAVRFLAQQGISQFLDLGSGLPTSPSVHEVARDVVPGARVVYVDHDPIVVAHNDAVAIGEPYRRAADDRCRIARGCGRSGVSGRPDSNRGPHRPERCALPGCATPRRAEG